MMALAETSEADHDHDLNRETALNNNNKAVISQIAWEFVNQDDECAEVH